MAEVMAHETVAKKISDWYEEIKKHNTESAEALREQLLTDLQNMTQNQTVLLYFNLIDSRYKLLMEEYEKTDGILKTIQLNADKEKTDQMIQYYYYFFSGMHEFYRKRFMNAINFYRIAESRLRHIPNEIERAEFNYQVAIAYYEIRQNYFAMNHAEKALEIYKANEMYAVREAQCFMVIGCNRMDLFHYQKAEELLQTAVHQAAKAGIRILRRSPTLTQAFAMKDRKSLRRRGSSLKRLSIKRSICNQHIRCGVCTCWPECY
ncbi:Hypothetical protein ACI5QL_04133 [Bacillus velezensis]